MALTTALELLGNANARISRLRWERVTEDLNKSLQPPLAKKDEIFSDCAPTLLGPDFAKRNKQHVEQMKSLRATIAPPLQDSLLERTPTNKKNSLNQELNISSIQCQCMISNLGRGPHNRGIWSCRKRDRCVLELVKGCHVLEPL